MHDQKTSIQVENPCSARPDRGLERMTGIEPAFSAWEADVLPLNYIRNGPQTSAVNVEARSTSTVRPPAELSRCGAVHCVGGVSLQRSVCLIAAASATD
jgi:hypothetical protein